jgi:hypothetical protein
MSIEILDRCAGVFVSGRLLKGRQKMFLLYFYTFLKVTTKTSLNDVFDSSMARTGVTPCNTR